MFGPVFIREDTAWDFTLKTLSGEEFNDLRHFYLSL